MTTISLLEQKMLRRLTWKSLVILIRILFGWGWLMAGVTKILGEAGSKGHSWFAQSGEFLTNYLMKALDKPNVPDFYKIFIKDVALDQVMFLNYTIPIVQIIVGLFLIAGFMILPSILVCLFMHINFLLSGNINLISIALYTSAFFLLINRRYTYVLSLDQYLKLENLFTLKKDKPKDFAIQKSNIA